MFLFRQPSDATIRDFRESQAKLGFSYSELGATAKTSPPRYAVDHTRLRLGFGREAFRKAKNGLRGWKQFDLGWLNAWPVDTPLESGRSVTILAHVLGLWSLNAAKIIYVVDEPKAFGFAYGTLPGHVEMGEERFLIELTDDDSVWYDILAFSRPRHLLAKIGAPFIRRLQKRFARDSAAAMLRVVRGI